MRTFNPNPVNPLSHDVRLGVVFFLLLMGVVGFQIVVVSNVGVLGIAFSLLSLFIAIVVSISFAILIKSIFVNLAVIVCFWIVTLSVDDYFSSEDLRGLSVMYFTACAGHCVFQLLFWGIGSWTKRRDGGQQLVKRI